MPAFKQGRRIGAPRRTGPITTRLPALLRDELGLRAPGVRDNSDGTSYRGRGRGGSNHNGRGGRASGLRGRPMSRVEARKMERQAKKASRGGGGWGGGGQPRPHSQESIHPHGYATTSSHISRGKRRQTDDDSSDEDDETFHASDDDSSPRIEDVPKQKKQKMISTAVANSSSNIKDASKQRRHVAPDEQTPLQRLLDKTSSSRSRPSSSSNASTKASTSSRRKRRSSALMTQQEREEEQEIAWLEAMLGRDGKQGAGAKTKRGTQGEDEDEVDGQDQDGLDDLLGELDRFYPGMYDESGSDEDEGEGVSESDSDDEGLSLEEESDFEDEEDGDLDDGMIFEPSDEDEVVYETLREEDEVDHPSTTEDGSSPIVADAPTLVPPTTGRYLPPAARAAAAAAAAATTTTSSIPPGASSTTNAALSRQLQGLLNRLGDSNLDAILSAIEKVYSSNPRAEVSQSLTKLILDMIAARSNLLLTDTFVVIQAGLVAGLFKIVGVEFAAGLIQDLIDRVSRYYQDALLSPDPSSIDGEDREVGKEISNLITLLGHLYNLQVVACPLVYDLIKLFLGQGSSSTIRKPIAMTELDVELLLKLVKTCGPQLRSDDASSLKAIVTLATEQASKAPPSTRARFMLETLTDLKNNRAKSMAAQANDASTQLLGQLKRYLAGMEKKRSVKSREGLRVVLRDLEEAGKRGKWWLVGAAWKGQEGDLVGEETISPTTDAEVKGGGVSVKSRLRRGLGSEEELGEEEEEEDDDESSTIGQRRILALARQHGMNTPSRRQIFSTLLTSTDYLSSSQSLLTLKLSDIQRREIIRVLLHVLVREEVYNPFYSLVGAELAKRDSGVRVTMQYCLWDYLRSIGERRVGGKSVVGNAADDDEEGEEEEDVFGDEEQGDSQGRHGQLARIKMWHLARCYGWWIAKGALGLNVLRTISFSSLKKHSKTFLHLLFLHLILSTQTTSPTLLTTTTTSTVSSPPSSRKNQNQKPIPTSSKKNRKGEEAEAGKGDPEPLRRLFSPANLRNEDLVIGLKWWFFHESWDLPSDSNLTASTGLLKEEDGRDGRKRRRRRREKEEEVGGRDDLDLDLDFDLDLDLLRLVGKDDPLLSSRVRWGVQVIRTSLQESHSQPFFSGLNE